AVREVPTRTWIRYRPGLRCRNGFSVRRNTYRLAFGAFRYTVATCTLLDAFRGLTVLLAGESRRSTVIATVLAPAGTVAATVIGAAVEAVTRTELAASAAGAGARRGPVAWPRAVTAGAARAAGAAGAASGAGGFGPVPVPGAGVAAGVPGTSVPVMPPNRRFSIPVSVSVPSGPAPPPSLTVMLPSAFRVIV